MRAIVKSICILVALCPQAAFAKAQWTYVAYAKTTDDHTHYVVQIDKASIRRNGSNTIYWLRIANADTPKINGGEVILEVKSGPSLYEDNCATGQFRIVQGDVLWGYETAIPADRPGSWQYVVPDSLSEDAHIFVCGK